MQTCSTCLSQELPSQYVTPRQLTSHAVQSQMSDQSLIWTRIHATPRGKIRKASTLYTPLKWYTRSQIDMIPKEVRRIHDIGQCEFQAKKQSRISKNKTQQMQLFATTICMIIQELSPKMMISRVHVRRRVHRALKDRMACCVHPPAFGYMMVGGRDVIEDRE